MSPPPRPVRLRPLRHTLERLSLSIGISFALIAFSGNAGASTDSVAEQWNVAARPRPAYDPAGIRCGGFRLFPSVELGLSSDGNIYRTRGEEIRDSIRSVRPRIFATSEWRNHELQLDAGLDARFFEDAGDEDVTNWFANAAGRLDITQDAWLSVGLGARELHEERGDPNSPRISTRPISREMLSANVELFRRLNRLSLGLEWRYVDLGYGDGFTAAGRRLIQNDRDRGESDLSMSATWDFGSGYQAFVRGVRYDRRYDRRQGPELYDRDSDGLEAVAGARFDLGAVLAGEVFFGHRRQSYDSDDRLPNVEGASFGGALTWNVTALTTIRAAARRTIDESSLRQAAGYLSTSLQLSVDHELRRNLVVGARVDRTTNQYEGIARKDDIATGGIHANWLLNRNAHLSFGYRLQRRNSNVERDDYDKNLIYVDVRMHY